MSTQYGFIAGCITYTKIALITLTLYNNNYNCYNNVVTKYESELIYTVKSTYLKTGGQYQIVNTVWLYCRVISPESPVA